MGLGRRAMVYLGLAEEDEGYLDDEYEAADEPVRERSMRRIDLEERELETVPPRRVAASRLEPRVDHGSNLARMPEPVRAVAPEPTPSYKITTLQPSSYNEARQIGEAFRDGIPVIMNLTEMADEDAKRLVDFAAGLIFGLRGSIEKVTNKVFLLSPSNVRVSAEDKRLIAEGGFYNQS
jgi:cell division inhibitor SepF